MMLSTLSFAVYSVKRYLVPLHSDRNGIIIAFLSHPRADLENMLGLQAKCIRYARHTLLNNGRHASSAA